MTCAGLKKDEDRSTVQMKRLKEAKLGVGFCLSTTLCITLALCIWNAACVKTDLKEHKWSNAVNAERTTIGG